MDLDAYVDAHSAQWRELESLVAQRSLTAEETARFVDLYERVSTHLSEIRSTSPDPSLVLALSTLVAKARRRAGIGRPASWRDLVRFFTGTFPAALYRLRWWWIITGVCWIALAVILGAYLTSHPAAMDALGTPAQLEQYAKHDFKDYYSTDTAQEFALRLVLNNAWVAAQCVALGVLGVPVVIVLANNAVNLGLSAAVMITHDAGPLFFGLILPHGLLELTGIFVAGGMGLRLFWSWVNPGPRTRLAAMASVGRESIAVVLGLIALFAVSALLEAFITPSPLPTAARIMIGCLVWSAFLFYALVIGRGAVLSGETGDLDAHDRGEMLIAVD